MGRFTNMPRADVVQFLEANGFAAYDSEPTDALREAAFLHEEEERERDIEEYQAHCLARVAPFGG